MWLEYAAVILGLLVVLELGFRIGQRPRFQGHSDQRVHVNTLVGALLAMVAFVLAITFSDVHTRYFARRDLVLVEANALRTAYLRTDLLPRQEAERSRELLRQYVELLRQPRLEDVRELQRKVDVTHALLWAEVARGLDDQQYSRPFTLYIEALNEVMELSEQRLTVAVRDRLPRVFVILLFASSALAMLVLGFSTGQSGARTPVATIPLVLVLSALLQVIVEFDRPDVRIAGVSQAAMEDLYRNIQPSQ